jgi:hypothetical protein
MGICMDNVATVCRFSNKKTPIQLKNSLIEEDEKNKNLIFNQLNQLFTLFKKNLGRSVCSDTVWSVCVFSPAYCLT